MDLDDKGQEFISSAIMDARILIWSDSPFLTAFEPSTLGSCPFFVLVSVEPSMGGTDFNAFALLWSSFDDDAFGASGSRRAVDGGLCLFVTKRLAERVSFGGARAAPDVVAPSASLLSAILTAFELGKARRGVAPTEVPARHSPMARVAIRALLFV